MENNALDQIDFGNASPKFTYPQSHQLNPSHSPQQSHQNSFNYQTQPTSVATTHANSSATIPKNEAPLSPDQYGQQISRQRFNSNQSASYEISNPIAIQSDQVSKQSSEMPCTDHWCTIAYHELSSRIGEMFHVKRKDTCAMIDGFTEPSMKNNRFSLGVLNNINRSEVTRNVRQHIGKGIEVHWMNNIVMLKCVSENPVFVQSPNCNQKHGWNIATVVKVPKGCCLAIFDMDVFAQTLAAEVKKGFEEVFALSKMCTVRISFVKGWGREYRRQSIMNTPCWIEIRLNGPLKWIDIVLNEIEGPKHVIGSCS